jgi:DNA-binding helix-hairpin-helix protein with protein kinase domain
MDEACDEVGSVYRLGAQLATGGQGTLYRLQDTEALCLKVYHQRPNPMQMQRLKLLRAREAALAKVAALPKSIAFAEVGAGSAIGVFLPFVRGHEIHELYGTRARLHHFPNVNFKFLVHVAYNLAVAFEELHRNGVVVGDVSEQNIKVLPDATVRLLDCEGFQIADGDKVFTSDVGTPLWTPPELQGKCLANLQRTTNHDLFGLAQLVFLLFFAGRHPFAGMPRGPKQLSPEAAICEYAFAFAPAEFSMPLSPPPGCPPFDSFPPEIRELFLRAFIEGSQQPNARPTASEWKALLEAFLNNLGPCSKHEGHLFWHKASTCPWCEVMKEVGVDCFPSRREHNREAEDDSHTRLLFKLKPHVFNIEAAPSFEDLAPEPIPSTPSGVLRSLQKTFSHDNWKQAWLRDALERNQEAFKTAEAALRTCLATQHTIIAEYNQEFNRVRALLQPALQALSETIGIRRDVESEFANERRRFEAEEFLQSVSLREPDAAQLGEATRNTLLSYGIETAADLTAEAIGRIPGFGPEAVTGLLDWRKTCEGRFDYDGSKPLPKSLEQEIERRFYERIKKLREESAKCEAQLTEAKKMTEMRLKLAQLKTTEAARQRGQAKVNIDLLEQTLRIG